MDPDMLTGLNCLFLEEFGITQAHSMDVGRYFKTGNSLMHRSIYWSLTYYREAGRKNGLTGIVGRFLRGAWKSIDELKYTIFCYFKYLHKKKAAQVPPFLSTLILIY